MAPSPSGGAERRGSSGEDEISPLVFMIGGAVAATAVTGAVLWGMRMLRVYSKEKAGTSPSSALPHGHDSSFSLSRRIGGSGNSTANLADTLEVLPRRASMEHLEDRGDASVRGRMQSTDSLMQEQMEVEKNALRSSAPIDRLDLKAAMSSTGSSTFFPHPEGPNVGPNSEPTWFDKEDGDTVPPKTDLLHNGHVKGGKLVVVMVGLPGRGKTYIARKVARYLRWINYRCRAFSLARYRIEKVGAGQDATFFDNSNTENAAVRMELLCKAVDDMMMYLNRGGEVVILDGSNFTKERRAVIRKRVSQEDGHAVMFIESICDDEEIAKRTLDHLEHSSPDYVNIDDFRRRIMFYKGDYETVSPDEGCYVKIYDAGSRMEISKTQGFLLGKIASFIMNLRISVRPVYISRHGESEFNVKGLIGGDPPLSSMGAVYSEVLAEFTDQSGDLPNDQLCVWSSTMKRARQTAKQIKCNRYVEWRALREIETGVCDGMTYAQVKSNFPEEYAAREKDKLRYRYPRGESYLDIVSRLEPVIFEMERQKEPLLVIAHQAVLRCLYAYFLDLPSEEIPYLSIPLHTVIKLTPQAFGCSEKRVKLMENTPDGQRKM